MMRNKEDIKVTVMQQLLPFVLPLFGVWTTYIPLASAMLENKQTENGFGVVMLPDLVCCPEGRTCNSVSSLCHVVVCAQFIPSCVCVCVKSLFSIF